MELSVEEAFDLMMELLGCGIVIVLFGFLLESTPILSLLERMV